MSRIYELKKVEEEVWESTPTHIQDMRRRFSFLRDEIPITNKEIDKLQKNINKLKTKKKEYEKEIKNHYQKLITFQINNFNIPTVSPTFQSGHYGHWSINLEIGGVKRKKYLGTDRKVREELDKRKDFQLYTSKINDLKDDLTESCREEIRKIVHRRLVKEMDDDGSLIVFKKWKNNKLKMGDYFFKKEK